MAVIKRHAFLSPTHNSWTLWSVDGAEQITNPGVTHRALEALVYSIDKLALEGWQVEDIYVDSGEPKLVLLSRVVASTD